MTASSSPTSSSQNAASEFARGLAGIVAGRTAICSLDGDLRYRGYSIDPLAKAGNFEEVAYLLLYGELPTAAELAAFTSRVSEAARSLDPAVRDALERLAVSAPHASPMDALRTGVSMLGQVEQDNLPGSREQLLAQAEKLLGQVPAILAAWMDLAAGRRIAAWPEGSIAKALLERLTGHAPPKEHVAIFGTTLVLYAEHEFNASTRSSPPAPTCIPASRPRSGRSRARCTAAPTRRCWRCSPTSVRPTGPTRGCTSSSPPSGW
jgi:citrate synthase